MTPRPRPFTMPDWLASLERLLAQAEALADSSDDHARAVAHLARHIRERRPKGA